MYQSNAPISVRQARQGKPVLAILAVSLAFSVVAGWALWDAVADDDPAVLMQKRSVIAFEPALAAPASD